MPYPEQEERHEECDDSQKWLNRRRSESSHKGHQQRIVEVDLEPIGQSDMPPAPEVKEVIGGKGSIEILGQRKPHQSGYTDDEVDIAGEVAVKINRIDRCDYGPRKYPPGD